MGLSLLEEQGGQPVLAGNVHLTPKNRIPRLAGTKGGARLLRRVSGHRITGKYGAALVERLTSIAVANRN
jgi:hypothetical protein